MLCNDYECSGNRLPSLQHSLRCLGVLTVVAFVFINIAYSQKQTESSLILRRTDTSPGGEHLKEDYWDEKFPHRFILPGSGVQSVDVTLDAPPDFTTSSSVTHALPQTEHHSQMTSAVEENTVMRTFPQTEHHSQMTSAVEENTVMRAFPQTEHHSQMTSAVEGNTVMRAFPQTEHHSQMTSAVEENTVMRTFPQTEHHSQMTANVEENTVMRTFPQSEHHSQMTANVEENTVMRTFPQTEHHSQMTANAEENTVMRTFPQTEHHSQMTSNVEAGNSVTQAILQSGNHSQMTKPVEGTFVTHFPPSSTYSPTVEQSLVDFKQRAEAFILTPDCLLDGVVLNVSRGIVYEVLAREDLHIVGRSSRCSFYVQGPEGSCLVVEINKTGTLSGDTETMIRVYYRQQQSNVQRRTELCTECDYDHGQLPFSLTVTTRNQLHVEMMENGLRGMERSNYTMKIHARELSWALTLPVVKTSSRTGYMTSLGFDGVRGYPQALDNWGEIYIPKWADVMVSFLKFDIDKFQVRCDSYVDLYVTEKNATERKAWRKCSDKVIPARVYTASRLRLQMHSSYTEYTASETPTGFQMLFSFHAPNTTPVQLASGLFNCSVDHYPSFSQHLHCNLEPECDGGQDETHCPSSSPACPGKVASTRKCYFYARSRYKPASGSDDTMPYSWERAATECWKIGAQPAMIKNEKDWTDFEQLFRFGKRIFADVYIGALRGWGRGTPAIYRKSLRWIDKTLIYFPKDVPLVDELYSASYFICLAYNPYRRALVFRQCDFSDFEMNGAVCETRLPSTTQVIVHPINISMPTKSSAVRTRLNISLTDCPEEHFTHDFLSCDMKSRCGVEAPVFRCPFTSFSSSFSVAMFVCDDNVITIPYTLVCDYKNDCQDQSDEYFCRRPPCDQFQCSNGQCVPRDKECDQLDDCLDRTDEPYRCLVKRYGNTDPVNRPQALVPPPAAIHFDGKGGFKQMEMSPNQSCPDTHYRCPSEQNYCLPVYTRCNGFYDCLGREDEEGCEEVTCPGFYRCRASSVCVHPDHLCDGWPQCPQHDDELLCGLTCPEGCLCQGLSLLCHKLFSPSAVPELRYLDASGSGMTLSDVKHNDELVCLILVRCHIDSLTRVALGNLRILDLRKNNLTFINIGVFLGFGNLKSLHLSNNPISVITNAATRHRLDNLETLDLSQTRLSQYDGRVLVAFHRVQHLNLSFTNVHTLGEEGFGSTPQLAELDLRGSPVEHFPANVFSALTQLRIVFTPNYRLCCENILPTQQRKPICVTSQSKLSSCERLLRSISHQFYFSVTALLALICNSLCIAKRNCCVRDAPLARSGHSVFVTNLNVANLIMSIYLGIVSAADLMFAGSYLEKETAWKSSVACRVAGFLSLLSSEASVMVIFLLTLDRFIVLHFPWTQLHFGRRSATAASMMTWIVAFVLTTTPMLPMTSRWEFYKQSDICIPISAAKPGFEGRFYWVALHTCFYLSLGLASLMGLGLIYRIVHKDSMRVKLEKTSENMVLSKRLMGLAITNSLTHISLGIHCLAGFVSVTASSEDTDVIMAVYVLPLNAALNPLLYTMSVVSERAGVKREAKLLNLLKSRVSRQKGISASN